MFWLIAAGLCLLAGAFVALPLWRAGRTAAPGASQRQVNQAVIRDQLRELETEFAEARIDAQQLQQLTDELYATALEDGTLAAQSAAHDIAAAGPARVAPLIVVTVLSLAALLLYQSLGYLQDLRIFESLQQTQNRQLAADKLSELIPELEQRVQHRPENAGYRYLLAQAQMQAQRYSEAAATYKQLLSQFEDDPQLWAFYAQALYIGAGRQLSPAAQQALQRALQLNPRQTTALGLQGMYAFEQRDYNTAVKAWSSLLAVIPPASEQAATINAALQRARALAADNGADSDDESGADAEGASIKVRVAADIDAQLPRDTSVFVYARAARGPKMPLAIKRLQLGDLPADVELNDSMAMTPSMRLSTADNIQVIARISMSGQAGAQSGDWEASSAPLEAQQQSDPIQLVIREQLK